MLPGGLVSDKRIGVLGAWFSRRQILVAMMVLGWRKHAIIDYSQLHHSFSTFRSCPKTGRSGCPCATI